MSYGGLRVGAISPTSTSYPLLVYLHSISYAGTVVYTGHLYIYILGMEGCWW